MKDFSVFSTVESLREGLQLLRGKTQVGFVPTMGALHHGHLTLIEKALQLTETVVVSIFVNPSQFNNPEDLKNYPRTLDSDLELIKQVGNVIVFVPDISEIYPTDFKEIDLNLGELAEVMEGKFRPGHFKGVMNVVKRLFDIVEPDYAFFGLKDYQQLAVIQYMVRQLSLPVQIIPCETIRESSGLARSSRNMRLSQDELKDAEIIYKTMKFARDLVSENTPGDVRMKSLEMFRKSPLKIEYLEIVHPDTLQPITDWQRGARMCIAAYCGEVRLIDNDALM